MEAAPLKLEQRKNNRIILSIPIAYKVFRIENLEKDVTDQNLGLRAEIQDMSLGGIQVVSEKRFETGDIIEFEAAIPGVGLVRTVAKVIWCRADESKKTVEYNSGIHFIPVYEDDLKKLTEYFKTGE